MDKLEIIKEIEKLIESQRQQAAEAADDALMDEEIAYQHAQQILESLLKKITQN